MRPVSLACALRSAASLALLAPALFAQAPAATPQQPGVVPAPATPTQVAPGLEGSEEPESIRGERLDPETAFGPSWIESMEVVQERERKNPSSTKRMKARNGAQGFWATPSRRSRFEAHSGDFYISNRWGDTRMSIEFGEEVLLEGAWFRGQASENLWADGLRLIGYRGDERVAVTPWLEELRVEWQEVAAGFERITRVEIEARAAYRGAGWYGLDDLAFVRGSGDAAERVVLDFDDLHDNKKLLGTSYGGLSWPRGTGDFEGGVQEQEIDEVHPPQAPPGADVEETGPSAMVQESSVGGTGTAPNLSSSFGGPSIDDAGAGWIPPDTCGAIGPDHFIAVVNQNLSVYDRDSGQRLINTGLRTFFNSGNASAGDPRVAFDQHSGRWVILATDFGTRLWFAFSQTDDATGSWFKTSITLSQGSDANRWPDFPTLGVDANGIYSASYMVGGNSMSLFAIDKAPLLGGNPSLGAVTAFRNLPWEGAIQPCVTYGNPGRAYCVSRRSSTTLRLRYVQPPLANPSLVQAGNVSIPSHNSPPSAPAQGSGTPISTGDWRPVNAVYRDGSVWTTHAINVGGRSAVRWYEIDAATTTTNQVGTVSDPVMEYFYPSIAVGADDSVAVAFSGSNASIFVSSYYAGRVSTDPAGQLSDPLLLKDGVGAYNQVDNNGNNRWGDYSLTSVDPRDDRTLWTIQEHARTSNRWGTRIGEFTFPVVCQDPQVYCTSLPNSAGAGAAITWVDDPSFTSNAFQLGANGAPANKVGLFFFGPSQVSAVFGDGLRCVGGQLVRLAPLQTGPFGFASQPLDLNAPPFTSGPGQISVGSQMNFQFWYRDPGFGGAGFNTSDAVSVTFCE